MIPSSFRNIQRKPSNFLQKDGGKIPARVDKFLKACALHGVLQCGQEKAAFIRFLMDIGSALLPKDYLTQTFGTAKAAQLSNAFSHEADKFKKIEHKDAFREAIEAHLVGEVMGSDGKVRFYLHLMTSFSTAPKTRLERFDQEIASLLPPVLKHSNQPAPSPLGHPPAASPSPTGRPPHRSGAEGSNVEDSAESSADIEALVGLDASTWSALPHSEAILRPPARDENEKG